MKKGFKCLLSWLQESWCHGRPGRQWWLTCELLGQWLGVGGLLGSWVGPRHASRIGLQEEAEVRQWGKGYRGFFGDCGNYSSSHITMIQNWRTNSSRYFPDFKYIFSNHVTFVLACAFSNWLLEPTLTSKSVAPNFINLLFGFLIQADIQARPAAK